MPKLPALQAQFMQQISQQSAPDGRMGIYHTNYTEGLIQVLSQTYPTVLALVGEEFFRGLARIFIPQHPPASINMDAYGADFPDFIAAFPPAASLPYLPDIARLDWAMHHADYADFAKVADISEFAIIPPEHYASLRIRLHPSLMLLASTHPIHSIFNLTQQPDETQTEAQAIDITQLGGEAVMVLRPYLKTNIVPLNHTDFAFIQALQTTAHLESAFEAAIAKDEMFDFAATMQMLIHQGAFSGFISKT